MPDDSLVCDDPQMAAVGHYPVDDAIIGAFGLPEGKQYISIKGDPTLRETAALRPRQESRIDKRAEEVLNACDWLLRKSGCYSVYIGFNSNDIRTESIFNPFNYEIHDVDALLREGYLERHFVKIPFKKKMQAIRKVRRTTQLGNLRKYLPAHWQKLLDHQRSEWSPISKHSVPEIMDAFRRLRRIDGFYLRYAALSLSQNIVRASFNCDGTYIIAPEHFPVFVEEIAP
jgi:hypothetical protein